MAYSLISDTGMRLAEAAGLHIDDLHLDEDMPYVGITPHSWRRLKTNSSQRQITLVGASLWTAKRLKTNVSSCFAFDRYTDNKQCRANSESNAQKTTDADKLQKRNCYTWVQTCPQRPFKSRAVLF